MEHKILSIFLVLCLISCKVDMKDELDTEVIEVLLKGSEPYKYKIATSIPTEGGYEIRKQAEVYQISKMNWGEYQFQAKEGYQGSETVGIVLSTSIGNNNFTDQKRWIFEIKVE